MVRGRKARQEYLAQKNRYNENIDKIIKIQSEFRRYLAMKYYKELSMYFYIIRKKY